MTAKKYTSKAEKKAVDNKRYYAAYGEERRSYWRSHHHTWKKTKAFARALGVGLPEAREIINRELRNWFVAADLWYAGPGHTPPRPTPPKFRRTRVWRADDAEVH